LLHAKWWNRVIVKSSNGLMANGYFVFYRSKFMEITCSLLFTKHKPFAGNFKTVYEAVIFTFITDYEK